MSDSARSTLFLSDKETRQLTGYKYSKKQSRWLRERAIPHEIDAHGQPVISRSAIERRLGGERPVTQAGIPDVSAMRELTTDGQKTKTQ